MAIGGTRLPPRLPPTAPAASNPMAANRAQPAPAKPAAPVTSNTTASAPSPANTKPAGLQPSAATTAAPVTSHTTVSPNPGSPSPNNPFVGPTKLNSSGTLTGSTNNTLSGPSANKPTFSSGLDHGSDGLSASTTAQYGGKVNLGGAQLQAGADYKPTNNIQAGVQGTATGNLGQASASASNSYNPSTGVASGKIEGKLEGPNVSANATQTTQLGGSHNYASNTFQAQGNASTGNASASLSGNVNTHNGMPGVSANAAAYGPHASASIGHTTQVGPFTFSNTLTAAAGTAGAHAGAHAGMNNGVLSWGANAGAMAGVGGGFSHTTSFDPSWFKASPPPAATASSQAQSNFNQYVKPYGEPAAA